MTWALADTAIEEVSLALGHIPTSGDLQALSAKISAVRRGEISAVANRRASTSVIHVDGVLTARPSVLSLIIGGTSYEEIREAIRQADADPSTSTIELQIHSPGGQVDGLFETIDLISKAKKPVRAVASQALSAAYALACSASSIRATSRGATFGSVGVVVGYFLNKERVEVTSTAAPKKRPDVSTEEGRAIAREYLDDVHGLLVENVAKGRGVSPETVNAAFGCGANVLADAALRAGMIDAIAGSLGAAPRWRFGEDRAAFTRRLEAWACIDGTDPAAFSERLTAAKGALMAGPVSHGSDELIPDRAVRGSDLGDMIADALNAPRLDQSQRVESQAQRPKEPSETLHSRESAPTRAHTHRDLGDAVADLLDAPTLTRDEEERR